MAAGKPIPRRSFLGGLGTAVALPWLDAMTPGSAAAVEPMSGWPAADPTQPPIRLAYIYVPNGVHMQDWTPATEGDSFELPPTLAPLAGVRDELLVLSGLTLDKARANGDGGGDHARSAAAFLTGHQPVKTDGKEIQAGISADQLAAAHLGQTTRLPSLELGCEGGKMAGSCDSGYSCAYSHSISWRTASTPATKEINPRLVFERLFGNGQSAAEHRARARREAEQLSILDFVRDDARRWRQKLGRTDQQKLDEYLTSLREIEKRIPNTTPTSPQAGPELSGEGPDKNHALSGEGPDKNHALSGEGPDKNHALSSEGPDNKARPPNGPNWLPRGIPAQYADHVRLMNDLIVLAFQTDSTRVISFMMANAGSNRAYRNLGVRDGHHSLSHHQNDPQKQQQIAQINRFHVEQLAYLIQRLRGVTEGEHALLDRVMLVYGSGISDGNRHNHDDLPILVAGRGGGLIEPGRHVRYVKNTPLMNLHLTMLQSVGAPVQTVGDSTGRLQGLASA